jgi:hypothetical protein
MNYELLFKNKPNQTRSEAKIPAGELLEILKPGTQQGQNEIKLLSNKGL